MKEGVTDPRTERKCPPCMHDRHISNHGGIFILQSLTRNHRVDTLSQLGPKPDGLTVTAHILTNHLVLVLSCQRELIEELKTMKLAVQPGKEVPKFNVKIMTKCLEIEQVGPAP